jgi:hypothetical protein
LNILLLLVVVVVAMATDHGQAVVVALEVIGQQQD